MNPFYSPDLGLLILRVIIGIIFFAHGVDKFPVWKMQPGPQLPAPMLKILKFLSIVEPIGGVAAIVGFLTPWAGLGFVPIMIGAICIKMFVWKSKLIEQTKPGWDLDLAVLGGALALVLLGGGAYSVDALLF
jgi:putative oxidoreductase